MLAAVITSQYSPAMTATERLYFADPWLLEFEAEVVGHGEHAGRPTLLLDRSAFYPEGGGQLADRGQIGGVSVADVQVDEAGRVHHLLDGALPALGARVAGRVEGARRRQHMALHTGQHVLSRALADVASAETVSARLGETDATIDVNVAQLADTLVARAEELASSVVDDDLPVRAFFPSPDELRALPLRREPKVTDEIRVVAVGDFDFTPCGGTHCTRTSQIGVLHVTGTERYKGGTRVHFAAGARARELLIAESEALRALGKSFTCGPMDVAAAIDKLRRELEGAREALGKLRARVAARAAAELVESARASGDHVVVACLEGATPELLKSVAQRISTIEDAVMLLAGTSAEGMPLLVARGPTSPFDCGAFVRRLAQASGGRGGGRPEWAEGRLPAGTDFEALARRLLAP